MTDLNALLSFAVATLPVYKPRPRPWTAAEHEYLVENIGLMPIEEIAARLGRSVNGLHVRIVRKRIPVASKQAGWMTAYRAGRALGMDIHSVLRLYRSGIFPVEPIPGKTILRIRRVTLYRWAVNPENWIYFKVQNMTDRHLKRLVQLAQTRWGDAWWTVGQTAAHHGVGISAIDAAILRGKLPAKRWGNWYVRRSEAERYAIAPGKGSNQAIISAKRWSKRADAFLLRARAEGRPYADIARMMKRKPKAVDYRYRCLVKGGDPISFT